MTQPFDLDDDGRDLEDVGLFRDENGDLTEDEIYGLFWDEDDTGDSYVREAPGS